MFQSLVTDSGRLSRAGLVLLAALWWVGAPGVVASAGAADAGPAVMVTTVAPEDTSTSFTCEEFWEECWDNCYDAECGTTSPPNGCGICCDGGSCGPYDGCYDTWDPNCSGAQSWCDDQLQFGDCACSACWNK